MAQHGVVLLLSGALLPAIMKTFVIQEAATGLMLGAGAVGFVIGPFLAGLLVDRAGPKASFLAGLGAETLMLVLFASAPTFGAAVAVFFCLNIAAGFVETPVNIIPAIVAKEKPGSLMNLVHMFFSVGAFISPFLGGLILQQTGRWQPAFWLAAGLSALLFLIFTRTPFPQKGAAGKQPTGQQVRIWHVLRERTILLGALAMFLYVAAEFGATNWIVLYLQKHLQFGTLTATSGLSILWLGLLAGRAANSRLALRWSSHTLVLISGALGLGAGLGLLTGRTPLVVYLWIFALGLCMSGIYPNVMADLNGRNPQRMGLITGFLAQAAAAGSAVAQPTLGVLAQRVSLTVAMSLIGVLMGLVAVVTYLEAPGRRAAGEAVRGVGR
jgi:fucose permease